MNIIDLHPWDLTPKQAIAVQKELAAKIVIKPLAKPIRYIAGVDCAFSTNKEYCFAAAVVWDLKSKTIVEQTHARMRVHLPYIPGLLSFREAPAILSALAKLTTKISAIMVDGQGYAHPRRVGIASHIGILTKLPTIGCAKSRLIGTHDEPGVKRGDYVNLMDKDELIGRVVRTRDHVKPLFISIGNLISLDDAMDLILQCGDGYRLPAPTRHADKTVAKVKKQENNQ